MCLVSKQRERGMNRAHGRKVSNVNAKELAQEAYDAVLRAFEGDVDRDLDGDDFDAAQDALEEVINDATQATDEAEDEEDEEEPTAVAGEVRQSDK